MDCDICGHKCISANDLNAHKMIVHRIEVGRVFICDICGIGDLTLNGYLGHFRTHGLGKKAVYDTFHLKPGEGRCNICGGPTKFAPRNNKWSYSLLCPLHEAEDRTSRRCATNLQKYGVPNIAKLSAMKDKVKETNIQRYGVEHVLQADRVREQGRLTNLSRYGVEYAVQAGEVKERIRNTFATRYADGHPLKDSKVRQKCVETCRMRYGADNAMQSARIRSIAHDNASLAYTDQINNRLSTYGLRLLEVSGDKKGRRVVLECLDCHTEFEAYVHNGSTPMCPSCSPAGRSLGEKEMHKFLVSDLGVKVICGDRKILKPYEVDLYLPSHNLCIEYDGLYWHSTLWNTDRQYHLKKTLVAENSGLTMLHFFSDEWNMKKDIVKSMLMARLGVNIDNIHARKCSIRKHENLAFYDVNHLQGKPHGRLYNYGLFMDNELVCSVSISPSYVTRGGGLELARFASRLNTRVVGGFGRLMAAVRKDFSGNILYTFADRRYSTGHVYTEYGFDLVSVSAPGYYYTKGGDSRHNRLKFTKDKLRNKLAMFDPALSEQENMANNGYYRIYDCGQYKFRLIL